MFDINAKSCLRFRHGMEPNKRKYISKREVKFALKFTSACHCTNYYCLCPRIIISENFSFKSMHKFSKHLVTIMLKSQSLINQSN